MILKVNSTTDFTLSLKLSINYDLEYIEILVTLNNHKNHTTQLKQFPAANFSDALRHYAILEKMYL